MLVILSTYFDFLCVTKNLFESVRLFFVCFLIFIGCWSLLYVAVSFSFMCFGPMCVCAFVQLVYLCVATIYTIRLVDGRTERHKEQNSVIKCIDTNEKDDRSTETHAQRILRINRDINTNSSDCVSVFVNSSQRRNFFNITDT